MCVVEQQLQRETNRLVRDKERIYTQVQSRFMQQSPLKLIETHQKSVQTLTNQLNQVTISSFEKNRQQFLGSIRTLEALNPLKIMDRGYSITYQEGKLVKTVADVEIGDHIFVTLQDGRVEAIVQKYRSVV